MKRKLAFAICGMIALSMTFAGCGSGGTQAESQMVMDKEIEAEAEEEAESEKPDADKAEAPKDSDKDKEDAGGKDTSKEEPGKTDSGKKDAGKSEAAKTDGDKTTSSGKDSDIKNPGSGSNTNSSGNNGNTSGDTSGGNNANTGGNTTGGNNGNTGGNTSGGNNPGTPPSQPEPPAHEHSWVEQFKTVTIPEKYHIVEEQVLVQEAWDEEIKESIFASWCSTCGEQLGGNGAAVDHILQTEHAGYYEDTKEIVTGIVHHEAIYETVQTKVVDEPARTEQVSAGFQCSGCGAWK